MEYLSKSEKETWQLAEKVARVSKPGDIFALKGDLGSGKTTFAKGFAKALGVKNTVTSPTFVVLKKYSVDFDNIKQLVHVDCYRLNASEDAEMVGLSEYLEDKKTVMLIEWPEKIWPIISDRAVTISFEVADDDERKITVC